MRAEIAFSAIFSHSNNIHTKQMREIAFVGLSFYGFQLILTEQENFYPKKRVRKGRGMKTIE
jgi:hypothetical protein